MKTLYAIIFVCIFPSILYGQDNIQLSGQVKDSQTKDNLEFCSISLYNANDSMITGTVTDSKGFFVITTQAGAYKIVLSYIGYKPDTSRLFSANQNKFIGVFKLDQDVNFISEVSISESSREFQIDRDVQIVTEKMKEGATSTKDVLDKINGVNYDRYNNSIKVDNDSKVIILVDGIEKDQEYVKNLTPERLKKIEVIRDPGGRYALEGYSAVINIILKKDYRGIEVFLNDRIMVDTDPLKTKYMLVQNNSSATVNYVYNKLNVYAKYSNNYNNFNLDGMSKKQYNNGLVVERNVITNNDVNINVNQLFVNYTFGADFYINPKHTLSYEGMLMKQPEKNNVTNEEYIVTYAYNDSLVDSYYSKIFNKSGNANSYNSLFYEGRFNENNLLNSNFVFSNYSNSYYNKYSEGSLFQRNEEGADEKNSTRFYLEFLHTFKNKSSLQLGYGNTWENLNSNFTAEDIKSNFNYSDIRHKLYSYYSLTLSKKISAKIGGAGETSSPNADGQTHNYIIFQPYADLKYDVSKMLNIKAKLRSSRNYPNIGQTNPYTYIVDNQTVRTGNPYLKPEVTNMVSLQTTILQGLLKIEPYFHFSNNLITEIGTLRQDSIFEYNYSNAGYYKNYGVEASLTFPFGKNIVLQSSCDFFNSSIKYAQKTNDVNDWMMSSQLIYQNHKMKTVAGMQYQNNLRKYITANGYSKGDNDFWILFVQQPFFKERLSVMLLYFTPITWGVDFNQGSYIKTDSYEEEKWNNIDLLKNMFMLEVSYRFNKGKSVNKKEKSVEQINEKGSKGLF